MDIPIIIALIMVAVISVFVTIKILTEFSAAWPVSGESADILSSGVSAMGAFDYMIVFFAIGVSLFSIISAFYVRTHPAFFIFSVILLGVIIMVSAQFTNAIDKFITTSAFSPIANDFPMVVTLVRNFPLFSLIVGVIIMIVMYGKPGSGGGI